MMILNAGKNEMFGRGSLSFESVIRGREKFFFLILLSSNFDAKSHATARSIFFSTGDSVPTPPVDFRDVIRLASCEYTVVSTTTAGATILHYNRIATHLVANVCFNRSSGPARPVRPVPKSRKFATLCPLTPAARSFAARPHSRTDNCRAQFPQVVVRP
jgi:hypothetical protein